jgi:thiol-disulfide isomerase/thioredoxin
MNKLVYFFAMIIAFLSCNKDKKTPEVAYQACVAAEEAYNNNEQTEKSDSLFEDAKKVFAVFFESYINTPYAQQVFSETKWVRRLNPDQLESVIGKVTDAAFKETEAYKEALGRLEAMKNAQPGHNFINIVSKGPEGNPVELADYVGKGKYVLLDFWASWCPDCLKEMPSLVELYAAYKDKNFEIVGYSLDKNADAWKKGIMDLNITWPQMSDCDSWNSQGSKLYAVQFIPVTFLIDPEGKIIEKGLSIEQLSAKIADLTK